MAPGANITLLIWTNGLRSLPSYLNCQFRDIEGAASYALDQKLGQIITISYGGSELDYTYTLSTHPAAQPVSYAHAHEIFQRAASQHVTILAASGDTGPINDFRFLGSGRGIQDVSWPASDPYVLAVGGTSIQISDANGTVDSEQAWNDQYIGASGGGLSAVFTEPDYQREVTDQKLLHGRRGVPDVAFPAALSFALYLSAASGLGPKNPAWQHWTVTGGTSASAPCWAGIIALVDQMAGAPLGFIQPALYHLRGQGMHDITGQ
jgi:subtilase family serine protease